MNTQTQGANIAPTPPAAVRWADLTAVALFIWLGVHSLRTFFAMVVWNIGEDRSPNELGLIALSIWVVGVLAWLVARWLGGTQPAVRLGLLFAFIYAANQFAKDAVLTPVLGSAVVVVWLWFLPALITALGRSGVAHSLTPGILLGLTAQVALQTILHGMDMPMLRGILPGLGALLLGAALFASVRSAAAGGADSPSGANDSALPSWGIVALGPYLILQLTLFTNLGRVQMLAGWDLRAAAGLVLLGLVASCAVLIWPTPYLVRAAAAVAAVVVLARPAWLSGPGIWLLPAVQVLLTMSIAPALSPVQGIRAGRVYAGLVATTMLFFVLTFLYYSRYGWLALWPVMAALTVLPALVNMSPAITGGTRRALVAAVVTTVLVVGLNVSGQPTKTTAEGPAPADLNILNYNIHQGFNFWSVPDAEALARVIETSAADVVGLQEVGRGWNINGGVDLVSWLRWRLPQYYVVYGPMNGELWGNVILSRYPIKESGWVKYPIRVSSFQRGLTWATIPTTAGDLLFVTTHFSAYAGFEVDRSGQADDLLAFWQGRPSTVIVGDMNATPQEEPVQRLLSGKLADVAAVHGLGFTFTFSSGNPSKRIDYIFSSPDVESLAVSIPRITASDHLPVMARVRLRPGTEY